MRYYIMKEYDVNQLLNNRELLEKRIKEFSEENI